MGQEEARLALSNKQIDKITRNNFEFQYVIGKGGFGKVKSIKLLKKNYIILYNKNRKGMESDF